MRDIAIPAFAFSIAVALAYVAMEIEYAIRSAIFGG